MNILSNFYEKNGRYISFEARKQSFLYIEYHSRRSLQGDIWTAKVAYSRLLNILCVLIQAIYEKLAIDAVLTE